MGMAGYKRVSLRGLGIGIFAMTRSFHPKAAFILPGYSPNCWRVRSKPEDIIFYFTDDAARSVYIIIYYSFASLNTDHILSSTDLTVAEGVFRLVMKYATFPNVRKWMLNGAPPGAEETMSSVACTFELSDCSVVCAE